MEIARLQEEIEAVRARQQGEEQSEAKTTEQGERMSNTHHTHTHTHTCTLPDLHAPSIHVCLLLGTVSHRLGFACPDTWVG